MFHKASSPSRKGVPLAAEWYQSRQQAMHGGGEDPNTHGTNDAAVSNNDQPFIASDDVFPVPATEIASHRRPTSEPPDVNLRQQRAANVERLNGLLLEDTLRRNNGGGGSQTPQQHKQSDEALQRAYRSVLNGVVVDESSPLRNRGPAQCSPRQGEEGQAPWYHAPSPTIADLYNQRQQPPQPIFNPQYAAFTPPTSSLSPDSNGGGGGPPLVDNEGRPLRIRLAHSAISPYVCDEPNPEFYLGGALMIGTACLFTWMARFIAAHGDTHSKWLWIVTCCGSFGLSFLISFAYYVRTSGHYHFGGRLWDGIAGAFPAVVASFGILFVYVFGIEVIVNTAKSTRHSNRNRDQDEMRQRFLVFGTVPIFLLVVLPAFACMLMFQQRLNNRYRAAKGLMMIPNNNQQQQQGQQYQPQPSLATSGWRYIGMMLRRVVVAWVCGVALAAHMALPAYGLSWCAYGLYAIARRHGGWVIAVILLPPVFVLAVLAAVKITRPLPLALLWLAKVYFVYPLQGWSPRKGLFWERYDNSLTQERMVSYYNELIFRGDTYFVQKDVVRANHCYEAAATLGESIRSLNVPIVLYGITTGKPFVIEGLPAAGCGRPPPATAASAPSVTGDGIRSDRSPMSDTWAATLPYAAESNEPFYT